MRQRQDARLSHCLCALRNDCGQFQTLFWGSSNCGSVHHCNLSPYLLSHVSLLYRESGVLNGKWCAPRSDPLLEIAMELERVATHDPYFVQRGLYPNVDFYSGIVLRALGVRSPALQG